MRNKVWMDSGAFSAFTMGVPTNVNKYCAWLHQNTKYIDHYAVLDVIGSAEGTWQNQQEMEKQGTSPVPCFHYGEDPKFLKRYIERYPYIALGGMVPISTKDLYPWLDELWDKYLTNDRGEPRVRVHGFGLTTFTLMSRYPWFSVDSSSWVRSGMYGLVLCYHKRQLHRVVVSDQSPKMSEKGQHYLSETPANQEAIRRMVEAKGFTMDALMTNYQARHMFNAVAYMDFAREHWELKTFHQPQFDLMGSMDSRDKVKAADRYPWTGLELYFAGEINMEVEADTFARGANRMFSYHYVEKPKGKKEHNNWNAWKMTRDGQPFPDANSEEWKTKPKGKRNAG